MKYLIISFFLLLYLLLPTQNSTVDAYYYAASVKFGQDLFLPHHLLYNATGFAVTRILAFSGLTPDVLALLKIANAVAAAAGLLVFAKILCCLSVCKKHLSGYLLIAGACFGYWRFATENETYILPLLLSLLASYFFIRMIREEQQGYAWLSGLMAASACLFHQAHFFWWLGLLIGILGMQKMRRMALFFIIPALLVPLTYALVLQFFRPESLTLSGYFQFVFEDFFKGRVENSLGLKHFLLTPVNFIRSFVQVHGNMYVLIKKNLLWLLPGLIALILLILAMFRGRLKWLPHNHIKGKFGRTHLLIFGLQLLFAFYAMGNAEFMVMLPFLVLLVLACWVHINKKGLILTGLALLIWNFSYGIFPNHYFRYTSYNQLFALIQKNPDDLFVVADDVTVKNILYYHTGQEEWPQVHRSPAIMALKQIPLGKLHQTIRQYQSKNRQVYTDCLNHTTAVTRAGFMQGNENQTFFKSYASTPVTTAENFYGRYTIYQVQ